MEGFRPPAVAGSFYPAVADTLRSQLTEYLALPGWRSCAPRALVVPHAGYAYSGPVAASGYRTLGRYRNRYSRVIVIGPAHRVPVRGIAVSGADAFRTPLGDVPVDARLRELATMLPNVNVSDLAHEAEHCIEVQLPFLQMCLEEFAILPLLTGSASAEDVAELLSELWGGPETLIIVSTDLSHNHTLGTARVFDAETARAILALNPRVIGDRGACGAVALNGLLLLAAERGMSVRKLDLRTSADMGGDERRVVGYGAFAFCLSVRCAEEARADG